MLAFAPRRARDARTNLLVPYAESRGEMEKRKSGEKGERKESNINDSLLRIRFLVLFLNISITGPADCALPA